MPNVIDVVEVQREVSMRVVSWNMGGQTFGEATHFAAWRHLLDVLRPDVALLQEARPLPEVMTELGPRLTIQPVTNVKWGSAVVVSPEAQLAEVDLQLSTDWMDYVRMKAIDVSGLALEPIRVISAHPHYGPFDESMLAARRDLAPKLDVAKSVWSCDVAYVLAREAVAGHDFVAAGDWNTARLFDHTSPSLDPGTGEAFFSRADHDGWVDLYHRRHGREGRTWFRGKDHGYQLDHAFADSRTAERVKDVWIDERAAVDPRLSDHAPLVVDFI